jgi:predicted DNA binding CopG/RHH family protein
MNHLDYDNMSVDELAIAINLDEEERELLESIENNEWINIPNEKEEIKRLELMAKNQLAITKIELEMSKKDIDKIETLAKEVNLSISSFLQDIIDKYLQGDLVEKI